VAIVAFGIWYFVQNSGNEDARRVGREAVVRLKAGLERGAGPEELRTLTDAVQEQYTNHPGAFDECRKTFANLQTHMNTLQAYYWSETYRKAGMNDLTYDCDTILDKLK